MKQIVKHRGIYVVYAREFARLGEKVFKVGMTTDVYNRVNDYPKGSQFVAFRQCAVGVAELGWAETKVLADLRGDQRFRCCTEFGREYFEGDCGELVAAVHSSLERFKVPWVSCTEKRPATAEATEAKAMEAKVEEATSPLPTKPLTTDEVEDLIVEFVQAQQASVASKSINSREVFQKFKEHIGAQSTSVKIEHAKFSKMICALTGARSVPSRNGLVVDRYIEFPSIHVKEAQDETMGSNDYVYKFLTAGPDGTANNSTSYYVRHMAGSFVAWPDFANAFKNYIEFKQSHVPAAKSYRLNAKHTAPFVRLGYRVEHTYVCTVCWNESHSGCCSGYSKANRTRRYRILDMELVRNDQSELNLDLD